MANPSSSKPRDSLLVLCGLVLVTACLYWARTVLIPLALAVLLTFILTPAVAALQRRGLGRLLSVLFVVVLALMLLCGIGYVITRQINALIANLPNYKGEIVDKVEALRGAGEGGFLGKTRNFLGEVSEELMQNGDKKERKKEEQESNPGASPTNPLYTEPASSRWTWAAESIGPAAEGLANTVLILILVIFMLMQREDLRNRLVRLVGHGRLIVTTQAFDEGAQRISRYLLMQLLINALVGVILTAGLFAGGLVTGHRQMWQYALLWGFIATVLRFLPYVGTWIAAALLTAFSIATLPGWGLPLAILGFFTATELLAANVGEPLLFGHSTGVSPLALLLSAAFWTWLWGPLGLILATPLTVILVVLGKYVPELHFFEVLFGDEQVLSTDVAYYQRLVARDLDEAADLVEDHLDEHSLESVYEDVLLPALLHAKSDRDRGELEADSYDFVLQGVRDSEENLTAALDEHLKEAPPARKASAIGCPGHDEANELSLRMLSRMLRMSGYEMEVLSSDKLTAEVIGHLAQEAPAVVVIGSLPPGGLAQGRYLCKRIRQQWPGIKILIGRWGEKDKKERVEKRLLAAGADRVAWTLHDIRNQIMPLLQVAAAADNKPELVTNR
ncbi:MAG TPA: AI-2E family transporter [Gemmataceae bacterium]|nr:AI-2E family transporter [Gemmataceae bacterium]